MDAQTVVKKKDYLWKRIKLGLWKKPDEDEKEFARQDLAKLVKKEESGLIDLVYGDQAGFNLAAKVVYAWQKRGERIVIPVTRGKAQNVFGLWWNGSQKFESFVFEGIIDSHVIIGCLDLMARNLTKETWLVLDNAPIHRSEEFEEKIKEWAKLGLKIYFLPAYCPDLNKIEIIWQKIKYDWLSWEAYRSYKNLCQELDQVLSQIGSLYQITFA
jgi:transposase